MRFGIKTGILLSGLLAATGLLGAIPEKGLDFKEVFEILKTNLPGIDGDELNRAAARGLIAQFGPRVTLVEGGQITNATEAKVSVPRSGVLEKHYAYVRPGQVTAGADKKFADAYARLSTNRLKGLIVDLRFSGGDDFTAAAAIADRFFSNEKPLIDYGDGLKKSTVKDDAISVPIAILSNSKTVGASEALAGILRNNDVGLLMGEHTGGRASIARNVTLTTGHTLRIATAPIKTGNGNPLPFSGLKPDISVEINPEDELAYIEEGYDPQSKAPAAAVPATNETGAASSTNRARRRINEAELVRMLRDGQSPDEADSVQRRPPSPPSVRDPVLARALDVLKGLALVQQARPL